MVAEQELNISMENENSPEEKIRKMLHEMEDVEEEYNSICSAVKSLQAKVMAFYQKRHSSLKELLDKHLASLPWADCSLDARTGASLHHFPESQVGHSGPKPLEQEDPSKVK